jgi:hypothetical protein
MKDSSSDIDELHSQVVFLKMRERSTDELISIWRENNQDTLNKDEFTSVQKVLLERLDKLPEQKAVINSKTKKTAPFKFSLIDRITIEIIWFLIALCIVLIIVSKVLGSR